MDSSLVNELANKLDRPEEKLKEIRMQFNECSKTKTINDAIIQRT